MREPFIYPAVRSAQRRFRLMVGLFTAPLFLVAACGPFADEPDRPDHWSPFHSQSNWQAVQGEVHVALTGFERGHAPGRSAEFNLVIENRTENDLVTPVCVYLVDEYSIVQDFVDIDIDVPPGAAAVRPFLADFDEELSPRAYGLAIVVDDIGTLIHTVRLGIADDEVRPWVDASELTCD
jgi:hypothetical protein